MGFFTVLKIAIVSLLVIYAGHMLWNYYAKNRKNETIRNEGEIINSALRNSKKMYEEMANAIQCKQQDSEINEPQATEKDIISVSEEQPMIIELKKEDMQEELKAFMENIT